MVHTPTKKLLKALVVRNVTLELIPDHAKKKGNHNKSNNHVPASTKLEIKIEGTRLNLLYVAEKFFLKFRQSLF